ncbi:3-oxoacyl-ACP reductase FabG [Rhizobium sp. P32RR-XVIII]|uniref:SDR family NAD(P)-dependent oxidoreductase n=1 Tax=Rhizobium sp. P32RR-XVIII TaxID=2726738 RepID=UPI00145733CC|nr:3-oxoacyl-ACP reductase FabG [Rhizobium sp. P32RR-XVIII]NLS07156.1 3-oxoacyl-ACP reductase FabG [Rhizobium sp. P32RR-XVIII]
MSATEGAPVAVVSGGTSGIGLATASRLLQDGYRVAVFGHGASSVKTAGAALTEIGGPERVLALQADVRDPEAIDGFFADVRGRFAAPSVFVASAGISPKGAKGPAVVGTLSRSEWDEVLAINLTGAMLCCKSVLPGMQEQGFGRIVLVGSVAGRTRPRIAGAAYAVSKAALAGLSRSIVTQYAGFGITANVVAPGRILTAMTGPASSPTNREALSRIPAGRLGTVEEVAAAIAFLASREAGFINGAILDINGGEFAPS